MMGFLALSWPPMDKEPNLGQTFFCQNPNDTEPHK